MTVAEMEERMTSLEYSAWIEFMDLRRLLQKHSLEELLMLEAARDAAAREGQ